MGPATPHRDCLLRSHEYLRVPPVIEAPRFKPPEKGVSIAVLQACQLEGMMTHKDQAVLLPGNVAPKRREEFLLGRCAAQLALRKAGIPHDSPVLRGAGHEPYWPAGFVGSITHCEEWAVAAAAKVRNVRSVGIDLENSEKVSVDEILGLVSTEAERAWILRGGDARRKLAFLFSAKESVYKALFPLCRQFFDFQAIELTWCSERRSFRGVLCTKLNEEFRVGYRVEIGCQSWSAFVFTHAVIAN
jgi:4'-phosphopantetheinyl transferase EntD